MNSITRWTVGRRVLCNLAPLVGLAIAGAASSASAFQQPSYLAGRPPLEVAGGPPARLQRLVQWDAVPPRAEPAWATLLDDFGPATHASWDTVTAIPSRIFGAGMAMPGAMASAATAEKLARAFVERHLALLAPGAAASDFELVADVLDGGQRTIGFAQRHRGMPVLGGQLGLSFRNDRLFVVSSVALPHVAGEPPAQVLAPPAARTAAKQWLADGALGPLGELDAGAVEGPFVLPLVSAGGVRYRVVLRVTVESAQPIGRWAVYLDARDGTPVAREQLLRFATGTVLYDAPTRYPAGGRQNYPATFVNISLDAVPTTADGAGVVSWASGTTASLLTAASGSYASVQNAAGANAQDTLSLDPNGSAVWSAPNDEQRDAQISAYTHANRARVYVRALDANIPWLDGSLPVEVNVADICNAYSDGQAIHFFLSGSGCENTARLADVVAHEWSHTLNFQSLIPGVGGFEGGLSEGLSDYLAATMANDSGVARGFFLDSSPLREIDPQGYEYSWPTDIAEAHQTGQIISGALWDLRKALVTKLGAAEGVQHTDLLWLEAMRRAVDIPSMYVEVLAADDDDGNLDNGTPNVCEINHAFGLHGLRPLPAAKSELSVLPPGLDGYRVVLVPQPLGYQCPDDGAVSAQVEWQRRENPGISGVIPMQDLNGALAADIPAQPDGTVVQYRIKATFGTDSTWVFPDNPADQYYEFFVGYVVPLYCTGFENDPWAEGWTHGVSGWGNDDWQWGSPSAPPGSTDPPTAYAGTRALGTDLGLNGGDGLYDPSVQSYATTPTVDTTGYQHVRLQYRRWLNVEDGYYDTAAIAVNGWQLWSNFNSGQDGGSVQHRDKEWRFQDVDLSSAVAGNQVQVTFQLNSDPGVQYGGWTIDELCIVGYVPTVCGDGHVTGLEACDNGPANSDSEPDACRTNCQPARCGDGVVDSHEECDDGNQIPGDGCEPDCTRPGDAGPPPPHDAGPDGPPVVETVIDNGCGCRLEASRAAPHAGPWAWCTLGLAGAARRLRRRHRSSPR